MKTLSISKYFKEYGIRPSKRLGQNFLIDESVLRKIIASAELSPKDIVLEIGPGLGILTLELAKRVEKVIAIEKDETLCQILKNILKANKISNVEIINKDVLKISNFQFLNYKIVANLPYYITSPIIRKFLEAEQKPKAMILMVQKEVGQRILAKPPHMNLLAISVQFYAKPKIIAYVPKNSFYPQPKVDSAIIKIIPESIPEVDTEKFFGIIKKGFSAKRKMLKNNLSGIDFDQIGLNPKIRAENLSLNDWIKIYETIK